jgi:hypothetical protein
MRSLPPRWLARARGRRRTYEVKNCRATANIYNEIGNTLGYGVVGTGDYNGDGTSDILLQNANGNVIDWIMKNGQFSGWNEVGSAGTYAVVNCPPSGKFPNRIVD